MLNYSQGHRFLDSNTLFLVFCTIENFKSHNKYTFKCKVSD